MLGVLAPIGSLLDELAAQSAKIVYKAVNKDRATRSREGWVWKVLGKLKLAEVAGAIFGHHPTTLTNVGSDSVSVYVTVPKWNPFDWFPKIDPIGFQFSKTKKRGRTSRPRWGVAGVEYCLVAESRKAIDC